MNRSRTSLAVAIAAGALTVGAGVGVTSLASADPTPTPSAPASSSPSTSTPSADPRSPNGAERWGHRGFGRGEHRQELAAQLADKLGVSQDRVTTALTEYREENRPASPPTTRPDPAERDASLAKSLAGKLSVDQAKVTAALQEIRSARRTERAADLKPTLDAAVKAGTLTQAEADAVTKAIEKGVLSGGRR